MKKLLALASLVLVLPACKYLGCKKEEPKEPVALEVLEVAPAPHEAPAPAVEPKTVPEIK